MKKISFSAQGQRADIGEIVIHRILPNRYTDAVGPFVFLDHIGPIKYSPAEPRMKEGTGAHPHRGIATLTYILNGEGEHFDSRGHHAKVYSGGIQWMKAGNGIIHDETMNPDSRTNNPYLHGFQFWVNLPSAVKKEAPEYLAIDGDKVPQINLPQNSGWLKVIAGQYGELVSTIPSYTTQYIYHIHLNEGKQFQLQTQGGLEYAAFVPQQQVIINDVKYGAGEFIEFDREAGIISLSNTSAAPADIILFGGETYTEPIVAQGPFVMNSMQEIANAYRDYQAGKYGKIEYGALKAE